MLASQEGMLWKLLAVFSPPPAEKVNEIVLVSRPKTPGKTRETSRCLIKVNCAHGKDGHIRKLPVVAWRREKGQLKNQHPFARCQATGFLKLYEQVYSSNPALETESLPCDTICTCFVSKLFRVKSGDGLHSRHRPVTILI